MIPKKRNECYEYLKQKNTRVSLFMENYLLPTTDRKMQTFVCENGIPKAYLFVSLPEICFTNIYSLFIFCFPILPKKKASGC